MLEAIVVVYSVVGCLASWFWLNRNKENSTIAGIYTTQNVVLAGTAVTMIIAAIAAYFGWMVYATICLVSIPLDYIVKRAIFAR